MSWDTPPPSAKATAGIKFLYSVMFSQKISRNELIRKSGLWKSAVQRFWEGSSEPKERQLCAMLRALGYKQSFVQIGLHSTQEARALALSEAFECCMQLVRAYGPADFPLHARESLIEMMKHYAKNAK